MLRMSYNMPSILKSFITKYPNVDLQLYENYTTKGLEYMLLNGEIDLAIINQRGLPRLSYIPFFEEELLIAVPAAQTLAAKGVPKEGCKYPWIDIRLLHNQPYIGLNGEQSIAIKTREIFSQYRVTPATVLKVKSVESPSAWRKPAWAAPCARDRGAHSQRPGASEDFLLRRSHNEVEPGHRLPGGDGVFQYRGGVY